MNTYQSMYETPKYKAYSLNNCRDIPQMVADKICNTRSPNGMKWNPGKLN